VISLDDYPYVGIDFIGDPYIPLPLGSSYVDIGMKIFKIFFFSIFVKKKTKIFLDDVQ
jgi:hypothetical protein